MTDHRKQTSCVDFSCDSYWSIYKHFIATPTNRIPLSPLPQIFLFESNADLLRQLKDIVLFARKTSEKVTIDTKINSQSAQKNKVLRKEGALENNKV